MNPSRAFSQILFAQLQQPEFKTSRDMTAKAKGFLKTATNKDSLQFASFLHDCLVHLTKLSQHFQRSTITVAELHEDLSAVKAVLNKYKKKLVKSQHKEKKYIS